MKYRDAILLSPEDVGTAGTKVFNLNLSQKVSRIYGRFKVTCADSEMTAGVPAQLPKIELVEGSTPLHSLTGYENAALAYYNHPGACFEHGQFINTLSIVVLFQMDFGRHLWDELLALDPERFKNLQLKIQHNEAASSASATANELEVRAKVFDEKEISPIGFLSAIEEYDYTLGSDNSYEEIDLPEDRPIRQMLVRAYQDGYEPWYSIDEARFDENGLAKIPFEYTDLEMYVRMMKAIWQPIRAPLYIGVTTSARTFYVPATDYWANCSLMGVNQMSCTYEDGASGRGGKFGLIGENDQQVIGESRGWLPWHCYQFPMGRQDQIDDWYDPAGKKPRLRLRASTGATSSTGQVVLEKLWRY